MRPPSPQTQDLRRKIRAAINQRQLTTAAIHAEFGCRHDTISRVLEHLARDGCAHYRKIKPAGWMSPRLFAELYPEEAQRKEVKPLPVVNAPLRTPSFLPDPVVTHRNGVKITRQPAPRGRYEVTIERGKGVIRRDNPGLAGLAA